MECRKLDDFLKTGDISSFTFLHIAREFVGYTIKCGFAGSVLEEGVTIADTGGLNFEVASVGPAVEFGEEDFALEAGRFNSFFYLELRYHVSIRTR